MNILVLMYLHKYIDMNIRYYINLITEAIIDDHADIARRMKEIAHDEKPATPKRVNDDFLDDVAREMDDLEKKLDLYSLDDTRNPNYGRIGGLRTGSYHDDDEPEDEEYDPFLDDPIEDLDEEIQLDEINSIGRMIGAAALGSSLLSAPATADPTPPDREQNSQVEISGQAPGRYGGALNPYRRMTNSERTHGELLTNGIQPIPPTGDAPDIEKLAPADNPQLERMLRNIMAKYGN